MFAEQEPAGWKAETGMLFLPRTRIVFSPEEGEGETIVDRIAGQSGLPVKEIKPQVLRWLAELKKEFEKGRIEIEEVGTLVRRADGSVEITPSAALDSRLNPLEMKNITLPVMQSERKPKKRGTAWRWIVGVLLLLLAGTGYCGYTRGWFDPLIERIMSRPAAVPTMPAPISPAGPVPQIEPAGDPAVDSIPHTGPKEESAVEPVSEPAYYLIAGVFSTRENAERYIREEGFNRSRTVAVIRPTAGGRFQVSIGEYDTKEEVDRAMSEWRGRSPGIWAAKK